MELAYTLSTSAWEKTDPDRVKGKLRVFKYIVEDTNVRSN